MTNMRILYGVPLNWRDVTEIVIRTMVKNNVAVIPASDVDRSAVFGDHIQNVLKQIEVTNFAGVTTVYNDGEAIILPLYLYESAAKQQQVIAGIDKEQEQKKDISLIDLGQIRREFWQNEGKHLRNTPWQCLARLHQHLYVVGGKLQDELPEQILAIQYLDPKATVLEIGANIGRNTMVIASVLDDDRRLVTLETSPESCRWLERNKLINGFQFNIENCALSEFPIIQKGWNSIPVSECANTTEDHFNVKCMSFPELESKYNQLIFDTLVCDCEGALTQILRDYPNLMNNLHTVIIENDFSHIQDKEFIDNAFKKHGLQVVYSEKGGWGCCQDFFYQVWKKT